MAFGYNAFQGYQPYPAYNPYQAMQDNLAQLRQQPAQPAPQQTGGIIWVQGEAGAKSYLVGAGNSVLLMDSETSTFYIKSTDASGMPMPLRIFDYKERVSAQNQAQSAAIAEHEDFITRKEFDDLKAEFDAMRREREHEPIVSTAKRKQSAASADEQ